MKLLSSNPALKLSLLFSTLTHEVSSTPRDLPKYKIPEELPDKFPEAELEQLVAENRDWIETIRTPIVRAVVAKQYIRQWFEKNCLYDETDENAVRPLRCNNKYERVFNEWDALERAYLQPCGFFDPAIKAGGPPRAVDRMRAKRDVEDESERYPRAAGKEVKKYRPRFGVPHELQNGDKRRFLKDLKLQHYEQLTMQLDRESKLAQKLDERTSEDYWDYFEDHEAEFEDSKEHDWKARLNKKLKAKTPVQLKKSGGEDPRDPRLAIEFLMNQMRLYAKRYVSMCPAQLKSKDHTNRIRRLRRNLDELTTDMEIIKLEKFQRQLLKHPKANSEDLQDRLGLRGAPLKTESDQLVKEPTKNQLKNKPLDGARGRKFQDKDDSGNLLLDLLLRSNLKENSRLKEH